MALTPNRDNREERQFSQVPCRGCGKSCSTRRQCPAYNVRCFSCDNIGHYKEVCEQTTEKQQYQNNRKSLAGAKCCVSLYETNKSILRVMNPTKDAIYLPANYVVASVSALHPEMVLPMSTSCHQSPPKIPTQNEKCEEEYLDFDLNNADLSSEQKQLLKCFLNRNRQVFAKDLSELGHTHLYNHVIDTGLTLKPSKCLFARPEVIYLGHKISKQGVQADISKVEAVESFPVPKTEKNVRSFLGLTNYYRKFIKGYSHLATPLNRLLRKDVPFEWSEKCQKAFDQLKQSLCSSPILAYPNMSRPFILTTDASGSAIAYILGQLDSEGQERVIAYGGRSLSEGEKAWPISELECLAVLEGIKTYHVYLANSHFKVYTDHHSLKWLSSIKQSTGRLARWSVLLQGYSFDICYREGSKNGNADGLSRREYSVTQSSSEPEDVIPSVDLNLVSVEQETNEHLQVTFLYNSCNSPTPTIMEITTGNATEQPVPSTNEKHPEQITEVIPENVGESQKECHDFKHIYGYLETGVLPEDKKVGDKSFLRS
ncbi:unnamed protein product [Mytilus edulis]|uniref:Reverse transcriptase RNase H-like domain-containing protein n=1 Tax=Mytilus edulis TaxID=6550 RepID=A0A8S3SDW6_MYTED|nr:unnamed protein product [Mytilus edulis]